MRWIYEKEINSRREKNIELWLNDLILPFKDKIFNIDYLKKFDSLSEKWKICGEIDATINKDKDGGKRCSKCFLKCIKLLGHQQEHDCGFDHKCQEKCVVCEKVKCNSEDCQMICEYKAGHENGIHKCSHFHKCTQNCSNFGLRECNKLCKYEYGHEEQKHL